jgi:glycosyltransferase involved in cell wall biosynthesis
MAKHIPILQINTNDLEGGAAKVAWGLFQACKTRGYSSWLAVGSKRTDDPRVIMINEPRQDIWSRFWWTTFSKLRRYDNRRVIWVLSRVARELAVPGHVLDFLRGLEDFHYPKTWRLLDTVPERPAIIHCHNLHSGYFDLRALPRLSQQVPVVVTLHDAWMLSGHCAHSFGCERWRTGCGRCPDLSIHPAIGRDATAYNWQLKREIYRHSRLYLATSSHQLMNMAEQSMLAEGVVEAKVIPNGIDTRVFRPSDRRAVRESIGLAADEAIIMFAAAGVRINVWKDHSTMRRAVALAAERIPRQRLRFIALGEDAPAEHIGQATIQYIPFVRDPMELARYYQAADIYLHAARAEVWGLVITEALACGTPVIATAVGGIPEQIRGLAGGEGTLNCYDRESATGILTPPGDPEAMAAEIVRLLDDEELRIQMGANAARDARQRFSLDRQIGAYIDWYAQLMEDRAAERSAMSMSESSE